MPMTLNEMKVGMADKVTQQVVDIFVRESEILELLPFDNCVSPSGGSTLTYGYVQKKTPSATAFRAINSEYAASQATTDILRLSALPMIGFKGYSAGYNYSKRHAAVWLETKAEIIEGFKPPS